MSRRRPTTHQPLAAENKNRVGHPPYQISNFIPSRTSNENFLQNALKLCETPSAKIFWKSIKKIINNKVGCNHMVEKVKLYWIILWLIIFFKTLLMKKIFYQSSVDSSTPSTCRPGFDSQAYHQCFNQFLMDCCHLEKTKTNKKRLGRAHLKTFYKIYL